MPLRSALDDLKQTTLRSLAGLLARLAYLSELRRRDGTYLHWGLARTYGEPAAQQAVLEAHRATLSGILRTPLRRMVQDATVSSEPSGLPPAQYVSELSERVPELLPTGAGRASASHLSAVLHALAGLLKTR